MIVAHGNGTRASDTSEAFGIRAAFGENVPPVTGFKWALGHSIAASGMLDLALALMALRAKVVPGISTLDSLDSEIAPFPVSREPQKPRSNIALIIWWNGCSRRRPRIKVLPSRHEKRLEQGPWATALRDQSEFRGRW
jgi:hypothetical protein